jgi:hypothetical protein
MIPKFLVYNIVNTSLSEIQNEDDGRFFKSWIEPKNLGRGLFKAGVAIEPTASQQRFDWREKAAFELGKLMNLPMAKTELASFRSSKDRPAILGTISFDYTPNNATVISLREFLSQADADYDRAYDDDFDDGYNIVNVIGLFARHAVGLPHDWKAIEGINDAADLLVGYLMLDTWLGATDRHDENLEIAISSTGYSLCPTFDHGDCLGSKLADNEQNLDNLTNPRLSESCWWEKHEEISTIRALEIAANIRSNAAVIWQEQLARITPKQIAEIFDRIPDDLITPTSAKFAQDLLAYNQQHILSLNLNQFLAEQPLSDLRATAFDPIEPKLNSDSDDLSLAAENSLLPIFPRC